MCERVNANMFKALRVLSWSGKGLYKNYSAFLQSHNHMHSHRQSADHQFKPNVLIKPPDAFILFSNVYPDEDATTLAVKRCTCKGFKMCLRHNNVLK